MSKRKRAVPASVGIATPAFGVRAGVGALAEQLIAEMQRRDVQVGVLRAPAASGYADPPPIIPDPQSRISLEEPFFWRGHGRLTGIVTAPRDLYDGSYAIPLGDATQILCPSAWVRDAVSTRTPRKVSTWRPGIDAAFGPGEAPRQRGETLRVLHFAAHSDVYRKGAQVAIDAFERAFSGRDDALLEIHSTNATSFERRTPLARLTVGLMTAPDLAAYYRSFDAVIYSSRAEAFASVAIEAAACGVPVIHTGATGMADLAKVGLIVPSRSVPSVDATGTWAEPDMDSIAERLRELDTDYDRIQAAAFADAAAVQKRFAWSASLDRLFKHLS